MKKIILSIAVVLAFSSVNAQEKKESTAGLSKGNILLLGDFSYSSSKFGEETSNSLTLSPGLGYMMSDKLAIVGSLAITSDTDNDGVTETKTSGFGVAAGIRYFITPADKFSLSIGADLAYGSSKEGDVKVNTTAFNVPVGLHYFVSNNFAITSSWAGLGYSSSKADTDGAEALNNFSLGMNMSSISFGLLYKM